MTITFAALLIVVASTNAGTVRFYDGTFNESDWDVFDFASSGVPGEYASVQQPSGGNPGEFKVTSTNWQGTAQVSRYEQRAGAVYNPQTQGAISSISYSEDNIAYPSYHATGPAIRQNGVIYRPDAVIFEDNVWTTYTWTQLTETDFHEYTDPNAHPDFSSSGSPVEFGFWRANSGSGYSGGWISGGIDNWCVSVHSALDVESNLVVNAGFENQVSIPDPLPNSEGYWAGNPATIVSSEQGITPAEGQNMMRFLPGSSNCDIWQLIDLAEYQSIIATGEAKVSASALFNRIDAGDPYFRVLITAYSGDLANWPANTGNYLDYAMTTIESDSDLSTWQVSHAELMLPENTNYIGVKTRSQGGFQGHYVDDVVVTIVPEPTSLTLVIVTGLALLRRTRRS